MKESSSGGWTDISAPDLERRLREENPPLLVDVRTLPEVVAYHIPGIRWIPLNELSRRREELQPDRETVLLCEHGVRSVAACQFLHQMGFTRLLNLSGGMSAWQGPIQRGGLPSE